MDGPNWVDLKRQLTVRFGEVKDPQHALALLSRLRQARGESIAMFAERVHMLAGEAFPGDNRLVAAVQRQVIGCFVDGLHSDAIKLKILRADPQDLEEAVTLATAEDNLRAKFALRLGDARGGRAGTGGDNRPQNAPVERERDERRIEPMQVDMHRPTHCYRCGKQGHRAKDCRARAVREVGISQPRMGQDPRQLGGVRDQPSTVICWLCGQPGHIKRQCPKGRVL